MSTDETISALPEWAQVRVRSQLCWEIAHENIGIYPQKTVYGDGAEKVRTDKENGWNDCALAHSRGAGQISRWLAALPPEHKTMVEDLLLAKRLNLRIEDGNILTWVNCNDTFFWGDADGEDITLAELSDLARCYQLTKHGGDLWVCRKREMRPQWALYRKCIPEAEWHLFDAAGPERDDPDGKRRG